MKADVYNINGEVVGSVELAEGIFGIEPNEAAVHQTVVAYLANQRQGTQYRAEERNPGDKRVQAEPESAPQETLCGITAVWHLPPNHVTTASR